MRDPVEGEWDEVPICDILKHDKVVKFQKSHVRRTDFFSREEPLEEFSEIFPGG